MIYWNVLLITLLIATSLSANFILLIMLLDRLRHIKEIEKKLHETAKKNKKEGVSRAK